MSADRVVLLGAGGHARVLLESLRDLGVEVAGFIAPDGSGRLSELPWLGDDDALSDLEPGTQLVNGIGSAGAVSARVRVHEAAAALGLSFRTVIDSRAIVLPSATLGAGAQVLAGAIVGAGATIGDDVIVNTGAIIDHDAVIGAHSHISPGAVLAGDVSVGSATHVGLGARVIQGVAIGSECVIGAGSVVLQDIPDGSTAVGVPAVVRGAGSPKAG